ncbi:GAF domain-containing protein [Phormidium tenue FACHB-886]|nr:GAF domain-containing protein [Phormidium tenue FACHB-886]
MPEAFPERLLPPTPSPGAEVRRLEALRRYSILNTPPEAAFDRITALVARLFDVPIALVSLVDESRAWFKSCYGFELQEVQRNATIFDFALLPNEVLVIPDAQQDDRFAYNPFVHHEPGLRFYAAAPLLTQDGFNLGTLCLLDRKPRPALTDEQKTTLSDLAAIVVDELELRLVARKVTQIDTATLEVTRGVSATTGTAFFQTLVQHLTRVLTVDYAYIGLLVGDNLTALRTIAVCAQGQTIENFEYLLQDTPCQKVIQQRKLCCYPQGVQALFPHAPLLAPLQIESYVAIPFFDSTGTPLGLLSVMDRKPLDNAHLSESLLTAFALRIASELERQQTEVDHHRSSFLVEVSTALASSLDYEQTLQSVARLAVPYFADWCCVDLLNDDGSISRVALVHSDPEKVQFGWELAQRFPRHLDDGYGISQVIKTGQSEIAIEITDEQLVAAISNPEYLEILRGVGLKSCIMAPLQARGRVLGSISFVFTESNRQYSMDDLGLAEDLARRAAIAIDNAHLYHTAQQAKQAAETAADRMSRLQTVTAALSDSLTPIQVAEVIVEQSLAALEADAALMALLTKEGTTLEIVRMVGYQTDPEKTLQQFPLTASVPLAEAVRTGQPLWAEPLAERLARYPHLAEIYKRLPFEAWISLPLMVEGKAVGGLSLSFKQFKQLSQDDREFMLALSRQCAQAISRAQLYEAERNARAEAEQASRVKDEFLAVLSHELRTPLNPILGWSKLLQNQQHNPVTLARGLQTIERNAKLQTQLIEDLLDVSRVLQGKLNLDITSVDLKSTIEAAMETVRLAAEVKAIQLQTRFAPNVGYISGDAGRLQQVVWNLLSNAVKFTPQGGQVQITLEQIDSQAQIQVSDTGQGITPEFLPYIFDRFRQADSTTTRKFGGLGLGLAIVRQLVELHGGTVDVDSPGEEQGTTFRVRLPLTKHQVRSVKNENSLHPADSIPHPLQGVRVLVVDDEIDARELLVFILEQAGAIAISVASPVEALQALTDLEIDVLISDIGMPDMDGYMLMQQVKSEFTKKRNQISHRANAVPKAIALTAYVGEINQQKALAAGFQQHLSKPVEPTELVAAIVNLIK